MTTTPERSELDYDELVAISAQLRHAYSHLVNGRVTDLRAFADGLLAPQIRRLELLAGSAADRLDQGDAHPDEGASPAPR